jgi:hypothetical protein
MRRFHDIFAPKRLPDLVPLKRQSPRIRSNQPPPTQQTAWGEHLTLVALTPSEMQALRDHWDRVTPPHSNQRTDHVAPRTATK